MSYPAAIAGTPAVLPGGLAADQRATWWAPGANLTKANLTSANLTGHQSHGHDPRRAPYSRAWLSDGGITGTPAQLPANWRLVVKHYLVGPAANLHDANLSGANMAGANLSGAALTGANLIGVTLRRGHRHAGVTSRRLAAREGVSRGPAAHLNGAALAGPASQPR